MKCERDCRDKYTLLAMSSKWPKYRQDWVCLICCTLYENYQDLAIHYLRHNWGDLKYFAIHPYICRKALDKIKFIPNQRKRDLKKADKDEKEEFKKPISKKNSENQSELSNIKSSISTTSS